MSRGRRGRPAPPAEVRRVQATTWGALVVSTVVTAGAFLLDDDANPVAQGLLAMVAALEAMIGLFWWRTVGRHRRS
jgi:hypothetical protein